MFSLSDSDRFYLYPHPTDMRKSFYTLSGIVTNKMGRSVQDGDAFIFINKSCTTMKILHMECGSPVHQTGMPNRSIALHLESNPVKAPFAQIVP